MKDTENSKYIQEEVTLNKRQIEILSEEGLVTEYENLSGSQKKAIVAIEDMLKYAEKKYDSSFMYAGYIAGNTLEPEQLRVYLASRSKDDGCFIITKTEDGYTDDYVAVFSAENYASYIQTEICLHGR